MNESTPTNNTPKQDDESHSSQIRVRSMYMLNFMLIALGAALFVVPVMTNIMQPSSAMTPVQITTFVIAGFLVAVGTGLEIWRSQRESPQKTLAMTNPNDLSLAVEQLAQNYELSRSQTNFAFLITAIFMGLGLLVILLGGVRIVLGLSDATNTLTLVSGVIAEFISGGALLIYRSNFNRLNDTSTRLYETWKIFAAYELTTDLDNDNREAATMALISALTGASVQPIQRTLAEAEEA
jgi:uncharacterized membrane protein